MKNRAFVILGAGGHGRVVADALRSSGRAVAAFLDPNRSLWKTTIDGIAVAGGDESASRYPGHAFAIGVGAIRNTRARRAVQVAAAARGAALPPVVAGSAIVSPSAQLEDGAQILTRAVVHPGALVGTGAVVNTGAIIEHDCVLGAYAFIGPGAILCGGVLLGAGAFVGSGAVILPGVRIGAGALVAAGAIVRANVADGGRCLR